MSIERRAFLKLTGAFGAGATLAGAGGGAVVADSAPAALSVGEMRMLKHLLARLLPADGESGGAVEAGAQVYIDRALGGYHAKHLAAYQAGLGAVAELLGDGGGEPAADRINALLGAMEAGTAGAPFEDGGKGLFGLVRTHMIEGMFGDPAYGGNRDFAGWRLIGYTGVQLIFSPPEQAVGGPSSELNRSMALFGGKAVA